MFNKIILYESIEKQNHFSPNDLQLYQKIKESRTIKNLDVYVQFLEE